MLSDTKEKERIVDIAAEARKKNDDLDVSEIARLIGSVDAKKRSIAHQIEMENKEAEVMLKTCCGRPSDRRLLIFIASILISVIVIVFSCYKLADPNIDCSSQNTFVGIISLIVGVWLRSPLGWFIRAPIFKQNAQAARASLVIAIAETSGAHNYAV